MIWLTDFLVYCLRNVWLNDFYLFITDKHLVICNFSACIIVMSVDKYNLDGDEAVRSTNDDASTCKRFAVQMVT